MTIDCIKVKNIKRNDDRYKGSKRRCPFNDSLYKILLGNYLPQFLHTTGLGSGCLGNWTQSRNKRKHRHHRSVLPYRRTVSHENFFISITSHLFCNSFIIIPKFTKNNFFLHVLYSMSMSKYNASNIILNQSRKANLRKYY